METLKSNSVKIYELLFNGRGVFPFRAHGLHWYSWENTNWDFMQEDFKNKYVKAGRLDGGTDIIILPRSFSCNVLGCKKDDITPSQPLSQGS